MANNLYEYFISQGKALPSIQQRRQMYGLSPNYVGTAQQNQQLLKGLTSGTVVGTARVPQITRAIAQQTMSNVANTGYTGSSGFVAETPDWLKPKIEAISRKYNLPTSLISAQLSNESIGFNQDVIYGRGKYAGSNVAGAAGIAQFIPSTAQLYGLRVGGGVDDRLNVNLALDAYGRMMSGLIKKYGNTQQALSVYNSGNPNNYKNPNIKTWYGSKGETYKYVRDITNRSSTVKKARPVAPVQDEFEKTLAQLKKLEQVSKQSLASAQLKPMVVQDAVSSILNKQQSVEPQPMSTPVYPYAPYPNMTSVNKSPINNTNAYYSPPQDQETSQNAAYQFGIPMPPINRMGVKT